jgi:hypothetical protein
MGFLEEQHFRPTNGQCKGPGSPHNVTFSMCTLVNSKRGRRSDMVSRKRVDSLDLTQRKATPYS